MKTLHTLLIAALLMGGYAQAQETQASENKTSAKASDLQKPEEKQKDIDDEITNARQRATLGSKSKWSFKSALAYNGGSLKSPSDQIRPNYRAGNTIQSLSSLAGTVGVNYRATERDSLSLSTGLVVRNPFHGDLSRSEFADPRSGRKNRVDRFEVSDPSLSWSRAYRAGNLQMVSGASYTQSTNPDDVNIYKRIGYVSADQTIIGEVGTKLSLGASISADAYLYTNDLDKNDPVVAKQGLQQEMMTFGIYPFLEYAFNDTYQFRTVFGYFANTLYKDQDAASKGTVAADTPYQSVGLGIVVTRDIYLYPNIQFTPFDIRDDRTNVALSTNISLF